MMSSDVCSVVTTLSARAASRLGVSHLAGSAVRVIRSTWAPGVVRFAVRTLGGRTLGYVGSVGAVRERGAAISGADRRAMLARFAAERCPGRSHGVELGRFDPHGPPLALGVYPPPFSYQLADGSSVRGEVQRHGRRAVRVVLKSEALLLVEVEAVRVSLACRRRTQELRVESLELSRQRRELWVMERAALGAELGGSGGCCNRSNFAFNVGPGHSGELVLKLAAHLRGFRLLLSVLLQLRVRSYPEPRCDNGTPLCTELENHGPSGCDRADESC